MRHIYLLMLLLVFGNGWADGLMMPDNDRYPLDFLRKRGTDIAVEIDGLVARTTVYVEFENEWNEAVDAEFSFPLPPAARATQILYTRGDSTFQAILRVLPQSTNPGEGEGGVAAEVTQYIGSNGLKLRLEEIEPGVVQQIQLSYIEWLDFHRGECHYHYPLATEDFVPHPVDHVSFRATIRTDRSVEDIQLSPFAGSLLYAETPAGIQLEAQGALVWLAEELDLRFQVEDRPFSIDHYSAACDTMDGHFVVALRPRNGISPAEVPPRAVVFLRNNSSTMSGTKLEESKAAIAQALSHLGSQDSFTLIPFDYWPDPWALGMVSASPDHVQLAMDFLTRCRAAGAAAWTVRCRSPSMPSKRARAAS